MFECNRLPFAKGILDAGFVIIRQIGIDMGKSLFKNHKLC